MSTKSELLAEVKLLRAENKLLKDTSHNIFPKLPESSDEYIFLGKGKIPVFKKVPKLSYVKNGEPPISLIEGDNLGFLLAAQSTMVNKVDIVYLDPPYNTGKEIYTYDDKYVKKSDKHSYWMSAMERRLRLVKPLLRDTGVIMCAISINELARLKLVMDEVFGEDNFIANVTWSGSFINNASYVSTSSDYMLIYTKNAKVLKKENPRWRTRKKHAEELMVAAEKIWLSCGRDVQEATKQLRKFYLTMDAKNVFNIEPGLKMYNSFDSNGELYRASDLSSPNGVGLRYSVVNPYTGEIVAVPKRGWVHSEKTFQRYITENQILWNGSGVPSFKRLLKNSLSVVLKDLIVQDREFANKLIARQIGRNKFSYPKDHNVLAEWFDYVTPPQRLNDAKNPFVVLDLYAGSGSSALAVSQLNMLDDGVRECILVTTNESNICEQVTSTRLRNVLSGVWFDSKNEPKMLGSLSYYKTFYLSSKASLNFDGKQDSMEYLFKPSEYFSQIPAIVGEMFV